MAVPSKTAIQAALQQKKTLLSRLGLLSGPLIDALQQKTNVSPLYKEPGRDQTEFGRPFLETVALT
jgi:hypothetical protein